MDVFQSGVDVILKAVDHYKWPKEKTIFIEGLKNFGDVLHASVVVRHYKRKYPDFMIMWGVSDKYYKQFDEYAALVGVVVIPMPHGATPEIRQNWKKKFSSFGFFKSIFPLCAVSGYDRPGNIVDNVLYNAEIDKLLVPRKPYFPHSNHDYAWHDQFCKRHNLKGKKYVVLEYNSYTLSKPPHNVTWPIDKYNEMLKHIEYPVVWTAAFEDPPLEKGIDARGISWRQAKVMIERSGCVVGCGSGLSVLSCCEGLNSYVIEINIGEPLSVKSIYGVNSISSKTDDPLKIAKAVNIYMNSLK